MNSKTETLDEVDPLAELAKLGTLITLAPEHERSDVVTREAVAGRVTEVDHALPLAPIGDANITTQARQILSANPEAMVWQESPSLALLVAPAIRRIWGVHLTGVGGLSPRTAR